jgi:hypothetical protein
MIAITEKLKANASHNPVAQRSTNADNNACVIRVMHRISHHASDRARYRKRFLRLRGCDRGSTSR